MDFLGDYTKYIATAAIVIVALILLYMVSKGVGARIRGRRGQRLGISEYHEIDKMRRLVLIRRDDVEHLVLIGGNQDLVVESGIQSASGRLGDDEADEPPRPALRSAPRPAVFGDRPPALRTVPREDPRIRTTPANYQNEP